MRRPTPLSGFPEWLPAERIVEQRFLDHLRHTFELWGYTPIHTRAVEPLEQLLRKGEIDKEVYVLRRLQADAADDSDAGLALHYDLTVPFARYVLENAGRLHFPFKRYQIQPAWRGERPQEGRFREFVQADIDVVGAGSLPFHYEAELPLVVSEALRGFHLPPVVMQVNNRKVSQGFFRAVGLEDLAGVLRVVDKLDKIGPERVHEALVAETGASDAQARAVLQFATIRAEDASVADRVRALGGTDPMLDEGLEELVRVVETAREHAPGLLVADLRIARGLDYYTGTVYETLAVGHESIGSICSGGRYDTLATSGSDTYPAGVLPQAGHRLPLGPHRCARRGRRRGLQGDLGRRRARAPRAGDPHRGGAERREVRQADPPRRPAWDPVRLVPRDRRRDRRGQGHPLRRAGAR
jgi:histidyl-tRNA synthetase